MGRFSTTTQIKNNTDRAGFISAFNDVMAKRGFVPCAEDDAAKSYLLAFSEGGWVTLASESEDVPQVAKEMNATNFSVEVVDSDFAILTLNNGDTVIFGDGSGYGYEDSPKGERKLWEPLLAEGKTWEQFSEVRDKHEVFVEDALCESAPIMGIDTKYIIADYNELSDMADSDENIAALHFKEKTADKKSKPMTLNAAFVKVFGEALEPLGFKKIKSRYPYFVRVVPGGEIVHIIAMAKYPSQRNAFYIKCGAATVYRKCINLEDNPHCVRWLKDIHQVYCISNLSDIDRDISKSIITFPFTKETIIDTINHALTKTKEIVLPVLNDVIDTGSSIDYFLKFDLPISLYLAYKEYNFSGNLTGNNDESLLWVKLNDREAYITMGIREYEKHLAILYRWVKEGKTGHTQKDYDNCLANAENNRNERLAIYDKAFSDKEWLAKAYEELQRRKDTNTEKLISYGLDVK